jgi:Domain of unknown function (DUF4157)
MTQPSPAQAQTSAKPSLNSDRSGVLQRQCKSCGQHTIAGECSECKKKQPLQRQAVNSQAIEEVPPIVGEVLRSDGQPIDSETRTLMEPRFQQDFSAVKVHTDSRAAASAKAVNALAYTVGRDIVFGAGQYQPKTQQGQQILAHELTHVVQQAHLTSSTTGLSIGSINSRYEQEADRVASQLSNHKGAVHPVPLTLQRLPKPVLMRTPIFTSTLEICHRVLKSRVFNVSEGGVVVTANAHWEASSEWEGAEPPQCGNPVYNITLTQEGTFIDSEYGTCQFGHGTAFSREWGNIPKDDYHLTIWTNNTNPNCCLRGDIEVAQQSGLGAETCTQPPPGPLEMLHTALDIAGLIPALGAFPDAINAGIYLVEGDWVNAGLSAVSIVPIFGDAASVGRVGSKTFLRVSGEGVERVGRDGIAKGLREARLIKGLREAQEWAKSNLKASAKIIEALSLEAIERLKTIPVWAQREISALTDAAKAILLGCTSPCKCELRAIWRRLEKIVEVQGVLVRGFRNAGELLERAGNLRNRILKAKAKLDDIRIGLRGSSVTGVSSKGGDFRWLPDPGGLGASDIDFFFTSPKLERKLDAMEALFKPDGRMAPDILARYEPELAKALEEFAQESQKQLGRKANAILLRVDLAESLEPLEHIIFK